MGLGGSDGDIQPGCAVGPYLGDRCPQADIGPRYWVHRDSNSAILEDPSSSEPARFYSVRPLAQMTVPLGIQAFLGIITMPSRT